MDWIVKDLGTFSPGKLIVFGGVYSNLEALLAFKDWCQSQEIAPDRIICTGDIIAYCSDPESCVQLIRDWGIHCIAGNVEIQLRNREEDCGCNFREDSRCDLFSRHWYPHAKAKTSESSLAWMETLPHHLTFSFGQKSFRVVHGSYFDVSGYIFKSTSNSIKEENFNAARSDVILAGHCGLPFLDVIGKKVWFNAGVIGMPANDGTPRVWFGSIETLDDPAQLSFKKHALEYPAASTRQKMLTQQLPLPYATTLVSGIWDNCEILPEEETAQQGNPLQESNYAFA